MHVKVADQVAPLRKRKHEEVAPLPLAGLSKKVKTESACKDEPTTPTSCKGRRASSIYRGVCWLKERKAWRARIEIAGKREHLGYFTSEKEAAMAYDRRARTVARKKSRLNFPELETVDSQDKPLVSVATPVSVSTPVHTQHREEASKKNAVVTDSKVADAKTSLLNLGVVPSCGQLNTMGMMHPFGSLLNLQQQINFMQLQYNLVNSLNAQSRVNGLSKPKTGLQPVCGNPTSFTYPVKSLQTPTVNCTNTQMLNPALFSLV